jgi:ABC-type iron transport system FetAB ATPase subunit
MSSVKKIEEMLESVEKKVHAGEWLRIGIVRNLMCDLAIWLNEEFKKDLIELRDAQINNMENVFGEEEE